MYAQLIDEQKHEIETLVDRILAAKQSDPAADVQPLEPQIDYCLRWQGDRVTGGQGIRGRRKFDACKIPNDLESR